MLLLAAFLVLLNGFFVAAEFALVRVRATRVEQLVAEGDRRARLLKKVLDHLDAHLSATQLGITVASLGLGWVGEPAVARLIEPGFAFLGNFLPDWGQRAAVHTVATIVAFTLISAMHIVLGELAPKSLAIFRPEAVALWCAWPMHVFYRIGYPFIASLNALAGMSLKLVGIQAPAPYELAHTDEELRMLVSASAKGGYLDESEREMLDNVFQFSERVAREVMVPRGEMTALYVEDPIEESILVALSEGHTRFPLCQEDKDHVLGFVHIKDLFARKDDIKDLTEIMRPLLMVPETASTSRLLKEMQRKGAQIAVLVDEYGGTAGMVTLEDLLEEIVGEIRDEFDEVEDPEVENVAPNVYEVDGGLLLEDAQAQFGFRLDEEPEVDTLGGYLFSLLGAAPQVGDRLTIGRHDYDVLETEGFRIQRVRVSPTSQREPDNADADKDTAGLAEARRAEGEG